MSKPRNDPFTLERVFVDGRPALRESLWLGGPYQGVGSDYQGADLAYEAELRDLARLRLPGLPQLFEVKREDDQLIAVYEAPEPNLASRLAAGPLSHQEVVQLGRDLCAVLPPMRAAGYPARLLAPSHVAGGGRRFFFSSPAPRGREELLSVVTQLMTPGEGEEDRKSLLYGTDGEDPATEVRVLGTLLWRALSGLVPWSDQPDWRAVVRARFAGTPPGPPLPRGRLAELITRCLASDPALRPASVREVEKDLAE